MDDDVLKTHNAFLKEINARYKDLNFRIVYSSALLTSPDNNGTFRLKSVFAFLNKAFKKTGKEKSMYKLLIRSAQDNSGFNVSNFYGESFDENMYKLILYEDALLNNAKGNPGFGVFIYLIEFYLPTDGGKTKDLSILRAA